MIHKHVSNSLQIFPADGNLRWPESHPQFQAELIKAKLAYPETKFKELERKLAESQKEVKYWMKSVPQAFA